MVSDCKISRSGYTAFVAAVKYLPVLVHVIIVLNVLDGLFFNFGITNWFYPIIGHSVVFDLLLLFFSYKLKFCKWHRILVYDMIVNVVLEWVSINNIISDKANDTMVLSLTVMIVCVLSAMCDAFVCKKKEVEGGEA